MADSGGIVLYQAEDGLTKLNVNLRDETVRLTLDQMADLFGRDKSTFSRHIRNIFAEGELCRESVVADFATTAADGKTYQVEHYNLDIIISVGYRVKSQRGVQFRLWASRVLKQHMLKGFALDGERMKGHGGNDYWNGFVPVLWPRANWERARSQFKFRGDAAYSPIGNACVPNSKEVAGRHPRAFPPARCKHRGAYF